MKKIKKYFAKYCILLILICLCLFFSWKIYSTAKISSSDQHFVILAKSFLQKRLDLISGTSKFPYGDIALFKGKYYLYFGPLPSLLLLLPVFIWGVNFSQHILTILTAIFSFYLMFRIAKQFNYSQTDSLWVAIFWVWGTIYSFLVLVNISAFQIQAISSLFILLAIKEFYTKRRYLLIGFYVSLAMATRQTTALSIIFFTLHILHERSFFKNKVVGFCRLVLPLFITLVFLCFYNYRRFGTLWESGYSYNITLPYSANYSAAKRYGLFSLHHIPQNIYYFLFKGPELIKDSVNQVKFPYLTVDGWGLSIIFTSPLFLVPFLSGKTKNILKELVAVFFLALPNFTYYGIGYAQFGYRYALDFYPFLLLILLKALEGKLATRHKILIVYSVLFNFLFMLSIWGKYPIIGR